MKTTYEILKDLVIHEPMQQKWYSEEELIKLAKKIFDKFDEYSCIKNDKWYLDYKEKIMEELKIGEKE